MKTILIIYPHWHPSNLAGVHRPRLIGNFLPELGWKPIVLTVKPEFFEETPDPDFQKTFREVFEVNRVDALPSNKSQYQYSKTIVDHSISYQLSAISYKIFSLNFRLRLFGDIGLRSFFQIRKAAIQLCKQKNIDFIWIPIPSFYMALTGRILFKKTKIPYGIDYIDPWVRDISNRKNIRAILSNIIARFLEPIAVKKASLITGVSYEYYKPVLERNFPTLFQSTSKIQHPASQPEKSSRWLSGSKSVTSNQQPALDGWDNNPKSETNNPNSSVSRLRPPISHTSFPYGFDPHDHEITLENISCPWDSYKNCIPYIYAGAFLPNSGLFTQLFFRGLKELIDKGQIDKRIKLFFVGTGNYSHKSIINYAKDEDVEDYVIEIRNRFPFLFILNFLSVAKGVIVIGSTEKHYTASKIFQSLLSKNPVFAIFHFESTVNEILKESKAENYLVKYNPEVKETVLLDNIKKTMLGYFNQTIPWEPDLSALDKYSAKEGARRLASAMEKCMEHR